MSTRCDYIAKLPYVKAFDGEVPYANVTGWIAKPCRENAYIVRYSGGIIIEGLCKTHAEDERYSLNPAPGADWERYDPAKHYGGGEHEHNE